MDRPAGELVEVVIEKLVTGGLGLGRHEGLTVLVPLAAPGDRLAVRLVERHASWARGELVELLAAGPGRREPPCPHYAHCGGCDLQHLDDATQLRLKVYAALETLSRLGGVRLAQPPAVVSGATWGYRRRAQMHAQTVGDTDEQGARAVRIGHYARGSHEIVPLETCPILVPALERRLGELRALIASTAPPSPGSHVRLELAAGGGGTWSARLDELPLAGDPLEVQVGPFTYRFDASCFFQGHAGMLEALVEAVLGPGDDAGGSGEAADLYAGVGLFTLPLAARHARVYAVESDPATAEYLTGNAARNRVTNVALKIERAETAAMRLPRRLQRVLVDPPRSGLGAAARRSLLALAPQRLTYVSCDVATLARDLRALAPAYAIETLAFLDLFPQTSHLEAVVQLRAGPARAPQDP